VASRPIKIAIIGDDSQLKKTLKQTSKRLEGFGKSVAKVGATAGLAFAGTATAVAGAGLKAFMGFETGMREVLTLLPGAGKEVFDELGDQVKNLSKEFGVLPDKVIPALYQSISAGIPKENVGEFLRVAAMAAKGGVTDLETAVDGITSVVNAYGSDVMAATEASDLLFTAVRLGKTDFGQLSKEVYKVAPLAAAVGIEFGEVTAALANLTAQGTPTAVAATQLKAAFAELAKEGTKADTAFRDLSGEGLAGFLAQGGSLEEALLLLKDGADASGQSVIDLFGSIEAGAGVLALTADGGAALSATMAEMDASAGATTTAFETMDQGLAVTLDKIKANIAVMAIEVGSKLAPHVLAATEAIMDGF
jgi:TP901 family phage tail tape measure protein